MGGLYVDMVLCHVSAILKVLILRCLICEDWYLKGVSHAYVIKISQKECVLYKSIFIKILCIMPYLVQVFVLIPYFLSISNEVGKLLEESLSGSFD